MIKFSLLLLFVATALSAQEYDSASVYVMFPRNAEPYHFTGVIGSTITFVPRPIAEEEIRQVPIIDATIRYNLPYNFAVTAHLGTNYITNLTSLGAQWNANYGRLAVAVGDYSSVWYGFAVMDGFNVDAIGWLNTPHLSFGIAFDEMLVTLRGELLFVTSRSTRAGDIEVASDRNIRAGGSLALYVEQPFFRNTHVLLGLKLNNLSNAYQSWLAFSTFNDPLLYPEFSIGILL